MAMQDNKECAYEGYGLKESHRLSPAELSALHVMSEFLDRVMEWPADAMNQAIQSSRSGFWESYKIGQREYEFVAEVTSAPPNSVFRLTKVRAPPLLSATLPSKGFQEVTCCPPCVP